MARIVVRDGSPCTQANGFHAAGSASKSAKGAFGQALVQKYFEYAGWSVSHTGVESVVDHIMQQLDMDKGELNRLPDLIVSKIAGSPASPLTHPLGQSFYVEVKAWATWPKSGSDMSAYNRFGTVLVVWVSKDGLLGTWLSDPGTGGNLALANNSSKVMEADFRPLAAVGGISLQHCTDDDCERRLRGSFKSMATAVAELSV